MNRWLKTLAVIPLASLIACQPEIPEEQPKSPEIIGSTIDRSSPPASDPINVGSNSSLVPRPQQPGIDYRDGDELDVDPRYADDMFYICETLGEESDRCDEWIHHYGG